MHDKWHGYRILYDGGRELALHIGHLPGRKRVALYYEEIIPNGGAVISVLAYFKDEKRAEKALEIITQLTEGSFHNG